MYGRPVWNTPDMVADFPSLFWEAAPPDTWHSRPGTDPGSHEHDRTTVFGKPRCRACGVAPGPEAERGALAEGVTIFVHLGHIQKSKL